jgi:hypothetical protein
MRGSRKRPRSAHPAHSASGHAGQANQLSVEKKYFRLGPAYGKHCGDEESREQERHRPRRAPLVAHEVAGEHRDAERGGREPERGESAEAEQGAEHDAGRHRAPDGVRQDGERAAQRGERGQLRQRLVGVHDEADRAEQQQRRPRAGGGAALLAEAPVARRDVQQPQRGEHEHAAREARPGVELEHRLREPGEGGGDPVVERRVAQPGEIGDARHDRIAGERHLPGNADAERVVRLPGIVPGEAREHERERNAGERSRRGRQLKPGKLQEGHRAMPRGLTSRASWCSGA